MQPCHVTLWKHCQVHVAIHSSKHMRVKQSRPLAKQLEAYAPHGCVMRFVLCLVCLVCCLGCLVYRRCRHTMLGCQHTTGFWTTW